MRKIFFLVAILYATTGFAQKKSTADKRFDGIDTAFARVLKDWHAAGFAVAVVDKHGIVYANGFGYRDFENKIPVTANTLFAIGSCSKAFTASLIGLLNKDGLVDLDKPVNTYLPSLKFYNDYLTAHVTLRDMMCHRTGLPRHDESWYFFNSNSRDSFLQRIQYMEPTAELRQQWQYNNFMFMLQGMVVEKLTGKSWEQNVHDKIFAPLGMLRSDFSVFDMQKDTNAAKGYDVKQDSIIHRTEYYNINAMGPAGSINSSVNEMAKWVSAWIHGGKNGEQEVIPSSYTAQAISSQMVIASGFPSIDKPDLFFANYGFGWFLSSYKGHYRVEHGGNIDGFSASTCFFPTDSIGIIVLCNQNGSAVPSIVRNIIADRMLGLKNYDWESDLFTARKKADSTAKTSQTASSSNRKLNTKPSHNLNDYTGLYTNKGYGTFEVIVKSDSLFALLPEHTWWLNHYHYDFFEPFEKNNEGIDTSNHSDPIQFNLNAAGDIESAGITFSSLPKPIIFTRADKAKEISADSLKKYEGEYDFGGAVAKVYIKGNALFLFVPGQPEYELAAIDKNIFTIKSLSGFKVKFNTDESGAVTDLQSIQPNGTFTAKRKK